MEMLELANYEAYNWIVTAVVEADKGYVIQAEQPPYADVCCYCGGKVVRFGSRYLSVRDWPIRTLPVTVRIRRQRYLCRECCRTFEDALAGVDAKHKATTRLITYIRKQAERRSNTSIALELGLSEAGIRLIQRTET